MREYTGKANGKAFKGIYTNSCMPNQKPKRIRREAEEMDSPKVKVNINLIGIFGAIVTAMQVPLEMSWKVGLVVLFLLASVHVEVEDDE